MGKAFAGILIALIVVAWVVIIWKYRDNLKSVGENIKNWFLVNVVHRLLSAWGKVTGFFAKIKDKFTKK
jgi:hypothetical protein